MHRALPALLLMTLLAACGGVGGGAPPSDTVKEAMRLVDAGDLDGIVALTCEAQKDAMRSQFDLSGLAPLTGGLDLEPLFDAVSLDTSEMTFTEANVSGDSAQVQLAGSLSFSFDGDAMRELFRQVGEQQGQVVDDATLDMIVQAMGAAAQTVPVDQTVEMVREDGSWRICSPVTLLPG